VIDPEDKRRCSNTACSIRMSCARANDEDFDGETFNFCHGFDQGSSCTAFTLRRALGRDNPDLVFTESRRRGKRHNAHAYNGPRKEFPGSEALFGAKLANAFRGRKPAPRDQSSRNPIDLQRPDPMTTRHLRDGRNIKED
jgi:hypothetical protein